jgi:hypothetical protein
MLHPMPPPNPRADLLGLAWFLLAMVVAVLVGGFLGWINP